MTDPRPFTHIVEKLRDVGLRPTRQRMALAKLLFDHGDRHVTAESLHSEAQSLNVRVSLATVYNTLHQFTEAGLLREIFVEPQRSYFDTNMSNHHHFYFEDLGKLEDISGDAVQLASMPSAPAGTMIDRVDVILRVRAENNSQ